MTLSSILLQSQSVRKYSNEFLSLGVDARDFGMGNAMVANIDNANAGYNNPAGLVNVTQKWQGTIMHAEYFQSIAKYDYATVAVPLKQGGTVGISLIRFGVDNILNTTQLIDAQGNINYDKISYFSAADYALMLSYGNYLMGNRKLSIGVNTKLIYRNIGQFANAFGFGLDAGIQYRTDNGYCFGAMAKDVTTTFNIWSVDKKALNKITVQGVTLNDAPQNNIELTLPKLQLGSSKYFNLTKKMSLLAETDLNIKFAQTNDLINSNKLSISPSAGFELGYKDIVFLRSGVNNFQYITNIDNQKRLNFQPNVGVGFKYKGIVVNYAFTNLGNQGTALYSNIFSVQVDMNGF